MVNPTQCPCCGQEIAAMPPELLAAIVSDKCAEIVTLLARNPGKFVPLVEVAAWVYRHDPEGGPMNAGSCINQVVSYNRPKMRAMGWDIVGRLGPYGGYKLQVHENARTSREAPK